MKSFDEKGKREKEERPRRRALVLCVFDYKEVDSCVSE